VISDFQPYLIYGLAWFVFGFFHSFLAGRRLKKFCGAYARLTYNIIAAIQIVAVLAFGRWAFSDLPPFDRSDWVHWPLTAGHIAAWILFLVVLKTYDLGLLAGTSQIRAARSGKVVNDEEALHLDGYHRFVRHPLYGAAFVILWTSVTSPYGLATAVWASLYLLIGAAIEERRLLRLHGRRYADYRLKTPAFIPWRGRTI